MPNVRISFHPAAVAEVEAAVQWYAERSPVAARAFAAEVNACVERVSNSHFGYLRGKQPQSRVVTVPEFPGSAAILAAFGAGETPALPGKSAPRYDVGRVPLQNEHCWERVGEAPERWPRYVHGTRRYLFPHFPFSLVYRIRNEEIEIVALAHHRKRSGYWRSR